MHLLFAFFLATCGIAQADLVPLDTSSLQTEIPQDDTNSMSSDNEETLSKSLGRAKAPIKNANALPLPRFVSLKSNRSNVHIGPGKQYPTEWVFVRKNFPVEILAEFEHWRKVQDYQGTIGWVHKSLLSGKRFALIQGDVVNFYDDPSLESKVIATIEPGVTGRLLKCDPQFCHMNIHGIKGWIKREFLYGIYPDEMSF